MNKEITSIKFAKSSLGFFVDISTKLRKEILLKITKYIKYLYSKLIIKPLKDIIPIFHLNSATFRDDLKNNLINRIEISINL